MKSFYIDFCFPLLLNVFLFLVFFTLLFSNDVARLIFFEVYVLRSWIDLCAM